MSTAIEQVRTVFGRGGGGGGGKGGSPQPATSGVHPTVDPNSLFSRSIARFLDLWCEGPIRGLVDEDRSILFNNTPLKNLDGTFNFTGVSWDTRYGQPFGVQSYMAGFPSSRNVIAIGSGLGTIVLHSGAGVLHVLSNPSADAAVVKLSTPGLYSQNPNSGNISGGTITFQIFVQPNGGSFALAVDDAFSGKCTSQYQRDYRIALPPGGSPWTIKVVRTSADHPGDPNTIDDLYFTSCTQVVDAKLAHPNVAYGGIQIDTAQFSGSPPARSYDLYGLLIKVPTNYDPITRNYTGAWDGTFKTAWSDNAAWCFYDIMTNTRYGAAMPASAVDLWKWELYTISQYCDGVDSNGNYVGVDDGKGGREPRYACNMILNSRQEAYAVLNTMASIFRGMPFWSSGAVRTTADMPKAPVALVTNSNVIGGEFKYEGTSLKARHTTAKVVWNDPSDSYRAAIEFVDDPTGVALYGVRQIDIVAYGATSRGQAIRLGKWTLDTERTSTETVHFRGGLDMAGIFPGDVISLADENYASQVFGGRAASATTTSLTIDKPYVILAGYTYTLQVTMPDGSLEARTITNAVGSTSTLNWSGPLSDTPLNGAVWALTSASLAARQFLVVSNVEVTVATFEIMGVFFDPAKYARVEDGIVVPPPDYNVTPTGAIGQPSNLSAVIRLYTVGTAVQAAIILSWSKAEDARVYGFDVQVRGPNDIDWQDVGTTGVTSIEYHDAVEGVHDMRVRSKSLNGKSSAWATLLGTNLTTAIIPSNVTGLGSVYSATGVAFRWTPCPDLNVDHYEVRRGASWAAGTVVAKPTEVQYTEDSLAAGTYTYWVAAVTTPQGLYSATPASIVQSIAAPTAPYVSVTTNSDLYALSWTPSIGSLPVDHYEVRYGASYAAGTLISTVKGTTIALPASFSGSRTFWVAAYDTAGNVSTAGSATITIALPGAVGGLNAQVIDNNVLLRWTAGTFALPIDHYTVLKGATYGAAIAVGIKSGTFTSVFETAAGTYTYWVVGVDTAGNAGAPTSVTAVVSQPPDYLLRTSWDSTFGGTKTSLSLQGGSLEGPENITETWAGHFVTNSWTSPADQIAAGYTDFLDPAPLTASYVEVFDYGATVPATLITVSPTKIDADGTVSMTIGMETSPNGTTWTSIGTGSQLYATSFRYLRVTLSLVSAGIAVCSISALNVKLSSKQITDAGTVAAVSTDVGGTVVTFAAAFSSVISISLSANSVVAVTPIYDFAGTPYPTTFKVLVFNAAGARVNANLSWVARGY